MIINLHITDLETVNPEGIVHCVELVCLFKLICLFT